jgi:hypothetical protein
MTTHKGCIWDCPLDVAIAYGKVRGIKLVLASVRKEDDASAAVLEEMGDCAECLRNMAQYLAGLAGSLGVTVAENAGANEAAAIHQFEKMLAEYKGELP